MVMVDRNFYLDEERIRKWSALD